MKNLILLLSLVLSSLTYAGTPDEDFTVDLTRESFRDGKRPLESDLYLNYQWVCGTYRTNPGTRTGTTGITLGEVHFVMEAGQLINRSFYFPGKIPLRHDENSINSYVTNEAGQETFSYFIRKNHGGLLVEKAMKVPAPTVPAISDPSMQAFGYSYCIPYDARTNAPKVMNIPWSDVYTND